MKLGRNRTLACYSQRLLLYGSRPGLLNVLATMSDAPTGYVPSSCSSRSTKFLLGSFPPRYLPGRLGLFLLIKSRNDPRHTPEEPQALREVRLQMFLDEPHQNGNILVGVPDQTWDVHTREEHKKEQMENTLNEIIGALRGKELRECPPDAGRISQKDEDATVCARTSLSS